jgi:YYY domain-containing protein
MLALLVAILLVAAILRFTGLDWDEHQHLHPDERFLTMVENSLQWPKSLKEYFDTAINPLNPYNHEHGTYVYGLFPVVMAKFIGQLTGKTGYDGVYLAGRAMDAVLDMLCVVLVFLIGRRLYDGRVGLLGALFLALSALNIQQSHYFTVDTSTTFFVTLALYYAVRVAQRGGWGSILVLAVAFGFAVSAKISVLSFLLVIGLAYCLRILAQWREEPERPRGLVDLRGRLGRFLMSFTVEPDGACAPVSAAERLLLQGLRAAGSILLVLIVAFFVFRIVQPQAFTGPGFFGLKLNPKWQQDMDYIRKLVSGQIDYPPSHQWTAREPVWYMLKNMVLWGLGVPLGLTVWASWALMAYELYRKRKWAHLLPWVWMTFTFFYQSIQFVKTVRYLLPIYPTMALMAGYGLIWLWDRAKGIAGGQTAGWWRRWVRPAATVLILVVILGTACWAVAFTGIYTRPVTRVAASRWMYEHIPAGSGISFELWDDPVPLNVDGHNASAEYHHVKMDLYWEDIPEKQQQLYDALQQAEYIALTSNRLYGSIPRLPARYPMTTRYYEALFSGELGYDRLITFTSRPRLFGIEINDDDSDESFTVYDHPKVTIFKKRPDFSMEKVYELFGGYDLDRIVRIMPIQVTTAPNNLMLDDQELTLQRLGGTWSRMFSRQSLSNQLPTLTWYLTLLALGVIAFPLGFVAFRRLRDRGYLLSKTLGLLLVGYLSWLLASLKVLPYTRATIAGVLVALLVASGAVAWVQRRALASFLSARWRLILANEVLFLVFFLAFWLIRRGNPDLWHPVMGGEKPMDLAYLNAIIKSTYFPAYDPWFAGGYINYYYYGWVIVATLVKLTAIVPWVSYNLAIPTCFALTAMGASCVVFNLLPAGEDEERWLPRALRYGVVGALLVAVAGNLGELKLLLNGLQELGKSAQFASTIPGLVPVVQTFSGLWALVVKGQQLPFRSEWWYWNASRVMTHGEINEFPFFTFLYADLHAHLTAMPFTLLVLGLASGLLVTPVSALARLSRDLVARAEDAPSAGWRRRWQALVRWWRGVDWALWLQLTFLALTVGELWCNNTWDFPTYAGVALAAIAIGVYTERKRVDVQAITQFVWRAAYLVVLSMLLFRPYHSHFGSAYSSVEPWKGERTSLDAYLIIHGAMLFILSSYLVVLALGRGTRSAMARGLRLLRFRGARRERAWHLYNLLVRCQSVGYDLGWLGMAFFGLVLVLLLLAKAWILFLALPILKLALALTLEGKARPERRLQTLLVAVGVAATLAVEYIVIKGDIGRMNTVFKFYLQVWIMWGIVSAVGLAHLLGRQHAWRPGVRNVWNAVLAVLLFCAALYPVFATYGKVRDRWDPNLPGGLDGMNYMTTAHYGDNNRDLTLEYDRQAINWMLDHIEGSPVIAEANTLLYRWGSRVSIYTGLPTIIGWDWHQKQQRAAVSGQVVDWRLEDLGRLYNTYDIGEAIRILERYQVGYVYVGELEQAYYDAEGLAKFEQMVGSTLEIAYRQGPVTIYRVNGSGAREIAQSSGSPRQEGGGLWGWIARHWVPGTVRADGPEKPTGYVTQPTRPALMLDEPVDRLPVVTDRGWNTLARGGTAAAVLAWWLALELIGLAAWPLAARVFPGFPDGGYGLSKGIGLLIVSYLMWIGASLRLVANSPPTAWIALVALGGCSFFLWSRRRHDPSSGRLSLRLIAVEEGLFTVAFLAFVGIRILNPDLWQPWFGGEKMMEIAFLNALTKSAYLPPYDPYFSGGYLNYYYYGQFIVNVLIKLTGLTPEVAFNLAVPTVFALTVSHAFALGYELADLPTHKLAPRHPTEDSPATLAGQGAAGCSSPPAQPPDAALLPQVLAAPAALAQAEPKTPSSAGLWGGAGAVVLTSIMGNLSGALQLLEQLARAGGASFTGERVLWEDLGRILPGLGQLLLGRAALPSFDYWYRGTRIIPNTINEFPFFSFLFADLHPHMIGIPFTILVIGLGLAVSLDQGRNLLRSGLRWAVLAIAVGALGVINTWDLPTYLGMLGCVLLYWGFQRGRRHGLAEGAISFLLLVMFSLLLYAPFYAHYRAQDMGLALVPAGERSPLPHFLVIWGFFLFLLVSLVAYWLGQGWPWARLGRLAQRSHWPTLLLRLWALCRRRVVLFGLSLGALAGGVGLGLLLLLEGMPVLGLLAPLLVATGIALLWSRRDSAAFLQRLMAFVGVGILVGVEIVYIKDFLAGSEWRRMNTVFKFYIQAWVLLGLAAGSALPGLWRHLAKGARLDATLWRGMMTFLLAASLVYTVMAIPVRVNERFPTAWPPRETLDGTAYMTAASYSWPDADHRIELQYDREAIAWLWDAVQGTPVIAEAPLPFYREGGLRVASYTGLPTIVGAHEREQRPWDQVGPREEDAAALYTTTDVDRTLAILERYRVRYVYLGQLERAAYPGPGLDKFRDLAQDGILARVYHNERVDIYEVLQQQDG